MTVFLHLLFGLFMTRAYSAPAMPEAARPLIADLSAPEMTQLWPGYAPWGKPLGVHFKGRGTYLIGGGAKPKNGEVVKGFSRPVYFFRDKKADKVSSDFSQAFHADEAGDIFLYCGSKDQIPAEIVIVHEAFHVFQGAHFKDRRPSAPSSAAKGWLGRYAEGFAAIKDWRRQRRAAGPPKSGFVNIDDIELAYIENQLLAQALAAEKDYGTLVAEFEAVREHRRGKLSDPELRHELEEERIEGTAEYVGWRAIAENFSPVLSYNVQIGALISPQPLMDRVKRFYAPGAAQCLLLDRAGADWKKRVESGEDIFSLIKEYFPKTAGARPLPELKRSYSSLWLKEALKRQADELRRKTEDAVRHVKKHDGWKISFKGASFCQSYSATCYDDVVALGEGRSYLENCHTEFVCKNVSVSIGAPSVREGGSITVLLDKSKPQVTIDNLPVTEIPEDKAFRSLSVKASGFSAEIKVDGRISSDGKTINIQR